ncbi:alpha/beta hydrolase [Coccidioides immitis RS]|uniref:Alpha/beta hydrolase n=4 Tax=Coccidioides immitis TaxID=5501 RepID=A0A0D8JTB5_COCIM|nr:alpha/beta hydrolase [Coccidioides immitis RS]KMP01238.1 hypothetical protein CIRG_01378 [Coccidioides immitis RMSCC 2394]KMU75481.1 hypothetical protein CISG_05115 [Coccidioides immitis RMSCC 3703]KMU83744.1 hypothetical protein CIHG_01527 [Coccidioides immitis H538.4]TPX25871.1 hypothetical protein DIZ76_011328 [Coccidioides immitis]KJF60186.1 alpha/beta hydrolase [Coccidioides immitis RS]
MPFKTINSKSLYYTLTPPSSTSTSSSNPLTLLFIHGLGSSSSFYFPIIPYLSSLGHRCITLDTHGSGASIYNAEAGNSISSIASDATSLLDALQIEKDVVVLGHSMGGIVASQLAASDVNGRVKAVVLIGPVNPNPAAAEVFGKRIKIVEEQGMEAMATTIPQAATGTRCSALVRAFIRQLLIGTNPDGYNSLCRTIAEAPVPDYASIKIPVLLLAGEEDKSAPLSGCEKILEGYKSEIKTLNVLSGVGHWHVLEAPEEVQKVVGAFLSELS